MDNGLIREKTSRPYVVDGSGPCQIDKIDTVDGLSLGRFGPVIVDRVNGPWVCVREPSTRRNHRRHVYTYTPLETWDSGMGGPVQ